MTENRNDITSERKIDFPVDDNLMELVDELTENDDDVIDLVDEMDALSETDDDIIDLEDEQEGVSFEEESIDLVEEIGETPEFGEVLDLVEETEHSLVDDDEVIDLMDTGDTDLIELDLEVEAEEAAEPELESESGEENGVIDLSDAVEEATSVAEKVMFIEDDNQGGEHLDAEIETLKDEDLSLPAGVDVTEQQLDAALERVIKKMFAERIDGILTTLIDRTILKELKALQDRLMGNLEQVKEQVK